MRHWELRQMQRFTAPPLFLALLLALAPGAVLSPLRALAQANPQQLAEANRVAMDAYNNLDIEAAKKTLEDAAKGAEKSGVKGPPLARTYANLGVVYVGGLSDNAAGLDAFVKALEQDPTVEPDPLVSTPEIQQVYLLAKRKVGGGTGPAPTPVVTPPARAPGPVEGNLIHTPAAEQLSQTGVPVYAEAPPDLEVATMEVSYRSLGMSRPKSAPMAEMGSGFGFLIPCTDVFEPNVEYFIVAKDSDGKQIGNAGTPQAPISVPIVAQRSQPAASLPGQAPPSQCSGGDECPPGMPGCGGKKGLGDTCSTDNDCGEGLVCADDFCATGEREEADEPGDGRAPRFFLDFGGSIGWAYIGDSAQADTSVPAALIMGAKPGATDEELKALARRAGWECASRQVPNEQGQTVTQLHDCTVAVQQPGFVPNFALQFTGGYYFTSKAYVGVMARAQLDSGEGTLAGILLGARIGYLITKPVEKGFVASLFAGAGVGQIQVQPPAQPGGKAGPWVVSGLGDVQLGTSLGYRFMRNVGINVQPQAHFLLPTFLFDLDLVGALEISF